MAKKLSIGGAVSSAINSKDFNLHEYKKSNNLVTNTKFKPQTYIPISEAFTEAISIEGIPTGQLTILRGHSDSGKTTALLETAISCQRNGILPVFIITEMKWSWEHAISMGLEVTEHCDEDGVLFYDGFFIYADRSSLNTIEDVAAFINNRLKEQREGKLPYSLCFLWDSIGSIPCKLSVESNNNNNEWNAGAISAQFKNHVNQQIILSRKEGYPYINTLVCTNKIWVQKGTSYGEQPKLKNSGGESMFSDAALVITFGNVTSSGSSKIKAVKNGREVEFAKRIKISVDKNHITGITTTGRVVATSHGFIRDEKKDIDRYKKEYSPSWAKQLGGGDFDIVEEEYSADDE